MQNNRILACGIDAVFEQYLFQFLYPLFICFGQGRQWNIAVPCNFGRYWNEITPGEYNRLVTLLVETVTIWEDKMEVVLRTENIKSMMETIVNDQD